MTTKYESVLSEADKVNLIRDHDDIADLVERTEQATLAKLQPPLDAIGAGGVSAREKHGFTHCIFHGDAPCGYSSWEQWINTPVKTNVFIRDATIDDWENARNSVRSAPAVSLGGQPFRKQPACSDETKCNIQELRIVFSGDAPNLTFVEVENEDGFSVNAGEWHKRFDGYTELRIKAAKE